MPTIEAVPVPILGDADSLESAQQRLLYHEGILTSLGAPDPFEGVTTFDSAHGFDRIVGDTATITRVGGDARTLRVTAPSVAALANNVRLADIGTSVSAL